MIYMREYYMYMLLTHYIVPQSCEVNLLLGSYVKQNEIEVLTFDCVPKLHINSNWEGKVEKLTAYISVFNSESVEEKWFHTCMLAIAWAELTAWKTFAIDMKVKYNAVWRARKKKKASIGTYHLYYKGREKCNLIINTCCIRWGKNIPPSPFSRIHSSIRKVLVNTK